MSKALFQAMPILIANLGSEMVYVLCSRLKAQNIQEDKAIKVINDVICSLFESSFVTQLFLPQEIGKHAQVKQLFEKLAHSSIMKLNQNSMSKLFDLMLMSFKMQLIRSRYPEETAKITFNHLNSLTDILKKKDEHLNTDAIEIVTQFINRLKVVLSSYNSWDYVVLKQTLLRFFQGKNIKVSVFMQEKLQNEQGQFVIPTIEYSGPLVGRPGILVDVRTRDVKETKINVFYTNNYIPSRESYRTESFTLLGTNLFEGNVHDGLGLASQNDVKKGVSEVKKEEIMPPFQTKKSNAGPVFMDDNGKIVSSLNEDKPKLTEEKPKITEKISDLEKPNINESIQKIHINENGNQILYTLKEGENISYLESNVYMNNVKKTKKEFNELADLLITKSKNTSEIKNETFELDLFKGSDKEDVIIIDKHEKDNKYSKLFKEEIENNEIQVDDTDLLELMDKALELN